MRTTQLSALAHQRFKLQRLSDPSQITSTYSHPYTLHSASNAPMVSSRDVTEEEAECPVPSASVLGSRTRNPTLFLSVGMRYMRYLVSVFSISAR